MKKTIFTCLLLSITITASETVSSKYPIQLYGFIRLEASYDNSQIAQGDWLLYARPGNSDYANQSIFTMNARHSRIGMKIDGPAIGENGRVNGLIEVDFAGGFPNSSTAARQPILRLRHAWLALDNPRWELRFGQDWALISGPFPNTTSFVVGAGKGNLWMRFPQIKYTRKGDVLTWAISANRPMAGNEKYEDFSGGDFDPVGDGELSGQPWLMGRVWFNYGSTKLSFAGHYGKEQINDLSGNKHLKTSRSINADLNLKTGPVKWTLKGFSGENLNSFLGGVFQGFISDSNNVNNIRSSGGWGQALVTLTDKWSFTIGGGFDDPDDNDLSGDMRTKNSWTFINLSYSPIKSLIFMLETEYLKTDYLVSESGDDLRVQFVSYFKF